MNWKDIVGIASGIGTLGFGLSWIHNRADYISNREVMRNYILASNELVKSVDVFFQTEISEADTSKIEWIGEDELGRPLDRASLISLQQFRFSRVTQALGEMKQLRDRLRIGMGSYPDEVYDTAVSLVQYIDEKLGEAAVAQKYLSSSPRPADAKSFKLHAEKVFSTHYHRDANFRQFMSRLKSETEKLRKRFFVRYLVSLVQA